MNNLKVLLSTLLLVVIATSCTLAQKQVFTEKTYPIQSFTSVKSDVVANVIYTQSNSASVRAEGDNEMIDNLRITESKGVLNISHNTKFRTKRKKNLTIYISSPTIESIDMNGVGNLNMKGKIKTDNLKINFEGVGNLEALEFFRRFNLSFYFLSIFSTHTLSASSR